MHNGAEYSGHLAGYTRRRDEKGSEMRVLRRSLTIRETPGTHPNTTGTQGTSMYVHLRDNSLEALFTARPPPRNYIARRESRISALNVTYFSRRIMPVQLETESDFYEPDCLRELFHIFETVLNYSTFSMIERFRDSRGIANTQSYIRNALVDSSGFSADRTPLRDFDNYLGSDYHDAVLQFNCNEPLYAESNVNTREADVARG